MRIETPTPGGPALARLRAGVVRARRRLADRVRAWGPGDARAWRDRWPVAAVAVAVVAALGLAVAASLPASSGSVVFVRSGEAFSADDLKTIARALEARKVPFRVDSGGRVGVSADRLDDASEALSKLNVGPRLLSDIDRWAMEPPGLLDAPGSKEERQAQAQNQRIAAMIRHFDGVAGAWVTVNRPKPRGLARVTPGATAFVYLETADDREISYSTVLKIKSLISNIEPDVKQDAVSVFDHKGNQQADAQNPAVTAEARDKARQERFEREIAGEIDWIPGVHVSVRFARASVPMPSPPPASAGPHPPAATPAVALPPLPAAIEPRPGVVVNRPMDLAADDPPAPAATPAPAPRTAAAEPPPPARVWVKVPRSFYLKWQTTNKATSLEDYQPLVSRTEQAIETAVRHVVPGEQLGDVKVSTIPDEVAPPAAPVPADARRAVPWWVPAAAAGATTALVMGLGFRVATRRPALRTARLDRGRYKIDEADDSGPNPGPSERVRELIRLNPEAAASVLVRWTGQGGPTP